MATNAKWVSVIFVIILSYAALHAQTQPSAEQTSILPWEKIADTFGKGVWFCGDRYLFRYNKLQDTSNSVGIDPNNNFIIHPNQTITMKFPLESGIIDFSGKWDMNLSRYEDNSWQEIDDKEIKIELNKITINTGFEKEGLYRLFCIPKKDGVEADDFQAYFIVYNNWKKDILIFCRNLKEEIELEPDPQLIRSCIAISHFDHTMEMISETSFLSSNILKALTDAVQNKKSFDNGNCPDFVIGLNKIRFKRFEGAKITEFVIFIPDEYNSTEKWPLILYPDPMRRGGDSHYTAGAGGGTNPFRSGLIEIWWHTSEVLKQYEWKDYQFFMSILEKKLNIDKEKVYLFGWCDNSITAMAIALNHPDQWAECGFVTGNSFRNLAGNALNLPLIYVKNFHDEGNVTGYFNFAIKCFLYYGCRNFKYKWKEDIPEFTGEKNPLLSKVTNPQRILYTIDSLSNPKAYWASIDGRIDENLTGTIDTCVWGQTVLVNTNNVDAYTLDLAHAPLDINRPIEIIEKGKSLGFIKDTVFTQKSEKYQNVTYIKDANLNGPVWDVFRDPYVIIWGSRSESSKLLSENWKIAKTLSNSGLCFSDSNFPAELIDSHNVILIGTPESNPWLEKIAGQLPIKIVSDQIIANGRKYNNKDMGYILVYPNPMNSKKYVAVFSGTSLKAINQIPKVYSQMQSIRPADVGIFQVTDDGSIQWSVLEKFDTVWNWHKGWELILANIEKPHPKWQWHQWFAKVIKQQLEVDVVICEDPFLFENPELTGQITYRDIFNSFKNDWILKIDVNGSDLRNILTTLFTDVSKREINKLIIEGVSLIGSTPGSDISSIKLNDIKTDKMYTIALPERCLNGQRIGMELRNYQIIGDDYVVSLLKEYFYYNRSVNIDAYLDSIKLKIF